jgi:hypothetical protein
MRQHRRPGTRTRVLCWLLAVLTVAGLGVLGGAHCLDDDPPTVAAAAAAAHGPTAGTRASDVCHPQRVQPAAVAIDATVVALPPAGSRVRPAGAPPTMRTPWPPGAVALTDIGVSRT